MAKRESVNITSPTAHQHVGSTLVSVRGDSTTPGMTIDVKIVTGTVTVTPVKTVVAGSPTPTWSTSNWTLSSGQSYTATAWKDSDTTVTSGGIDFTT